MKPFPIPTLIPEEVEHDIVNYVDKIIEKKRKNSHQSSFEDEKKIDEIIYTLYELTADDITLVKKSSV